MSREKTIIELEDDDAALLLTKDGMRFYLPDYNSEDDIMQENALVITIIGFLLHSRNEEFESLINKTIDAEIKGVLANEKT